MPPFVLTVWVQYQVKTRVKQNQLEPLQATEAFRRFSSPMCTMG